MRKIGTIAALLLITLIASASITLINLATQVTGTLPIANGGTGNTVGINSAVEFGTTSAPACTSGGTTTFLGAGGGVDSTTEASVVRFVAPVATTISHMQVKIGGNVPSGETAAFKVSKNGSTTSTPNCNVAAAASTCSDNSTTLSLAAGDLVDISLACSGGTSALTASVSVDLMAQ